VTTFQTVFGGTTIFPSDVTLLELALDDDVTLEWPLEAATGANIIARINEITPSGSFTITMPDATQTGVGQTILFNNLGPDDVTIVKAGGGALLSLSAGEVWQLYLTDNTTTAGSWSIFQYGATTAQAQAAALEGPGIVAIGSVLAQEMAVSTINTTPYTALTTDRSAAFVWIGSSGTLNLPAAQTAGQGWFLNVRNGGTGDWTIDPSSSETINDNTTLVLQPGDSAVIATDGLEWWTIGLGKQAVFAFDYTSIDLTGVTGNYVLTGAELNRIAYKFTGALAGNTTIVAPPTLQQYWVTNAATGFTLSLSVSGSASPVNIAGGGKGIYYSNGVDMVLANTVAGIATPISVADGGTGATSAANARTNLSAAAQGANADITRLSALADGSVSATAAGFSGDAGAGLYRPAASQIALAANAIRAVFVSTAASGNIAIGPSALASVSSATAKCVAIGDRAGTLSVGGTENTAIGYLAFSKNVSGIRNTCMGSLAGLEMTGSNNVCVGYNTIGTNPASGSQNTVVGASANITGSGSNNTLIGFSAGGVATGSNNTLLGNGATASATSVSNEITLGNGSVSVLRCQVTSITALSDARDKDDIQTLPAGMDLEFIDTITPRRWNWNARDGSKVGVADIGFVAQELKEAMAQCGIEVPGLIYESNPDRLEVAAGLLLPIAVRAIQQLSDALNNTNGRLRALEESFGG